MNQKARNLSLRYDRKVFDGKTYTGVEAADCKAIALAYQTNKELTIDADCRVYDSSNRWIADAKVRLKGEANG